MNKHGFSLPETLMAMMILASVMFVMTKITGTALRQSGMAHRILERTIVIKNRITDIATFNREELKEKKDNHTITLRKKTIDHKKSELKDIAKSVQAITVEGTWNNDTIALTTFTYQNSS